MKPKIGFHVAGLDHRRRPHIQARHVLGAALLYSLPDPRRLQGARGLLMHGCQLAKAACHLTTSSFLLQNSIISFSNIIQKSILKRKVLLFIINHKLAWRFVSVFDQLKLFIGLRILVQLNFFLDSSLLQEVECLGACVNAPMIQVNNEYFYEDLDYDSMT